MNRDKIENLKQIRERVENRRGKNGSRGSYLIPDESADYKEIVEEAYEEIHGRV